METRTRANMDADWAIFIVNDVAVAREAICDVVYRYRFNILSDNRSIDIDDFLDFAISFSVVFAVSKNNSPIQNRSIKTNEGNFC